jgi:hypothetical protein
MVCDGVWSGVEPVPRRSMMEFMHLLSGRRVLLVEFFFPLAPSVGIKTPARPGRPVCQLRPARWTSRARVWLTEHAESSLRVQLCTARAAADARERNSALQRARGAPASRT